MVFIRNEKLFDEVTTIGDSEIMNVYNANSLRIEAKTDSSATFKVWLKSDSGIDWCMPAIVLNQATLKLENPAVITSGSVYAYSVGLAGVTQVKIELTANSGKCTITASAFNN
jgi:hypothetical protein